MSISENSGVFNSVKLDERLIGWTLAEKAPSSIAYIELEQIFFRPFVISLAVLAAPHLTRLAHDLHSSNMTDELTHFLVELVHSKHLKVFVFFERHSNWLPCQIDSDLLKINGLLDHNSLDLREIPVF